MTTKLPRRAYPIIDPAQLPDPEPVPDAMFQFFDIVDTAAMLRAYLAPRPPLGEDRPATVVVGGESFVYYNPDNLNDKVSPDCYVAFDVDADAIVRRNGYFIWEVGKPPDFVLEIASPSTRRVDITRKRTLYAAIGIGEYWRYDGTGGELYGSTLAGERLAAGAYQPLDLQRRPDGEMLGYSPVLNLVVSGRPDHLLRFIVPETGAYLQTLEEEQAARESARRELAAERAARVAAEERLRQLERRLRESEPGGLG